MAKTKTPKTAADGTQQPKDPTQQPERTYFQRRVFDEIGVTPELNRIKLKFDCGDQMRTSTATMDIFSEDKNGNIRILVYSIDGWVRQYVDPHQLSDLNASEFARMKNYYVTRIHPDNIKDDGKKYDFPPGQGVFPFFPPNLLKKFNAKQDIETLILTEGYFKAMCASLRGFDIVGLGSITHYADSNTRDLHPDIKKLINTCHVKKVVLLYDGDCINISTKDLEKKQDLARRPKGFYSAILNTRDLLVDFSDVKIEFAYVRSDNLIDHPKGLDDLLITPAYKTHTKDILKDLIQEEMNGTYFFRMNVRDQIARLKRKFYLDSVNSFYKHWEEQIGVKEFVFEGNIYFYDPNEDKCKRTMPLALKDFVRVGDDYFQMIEKLNIRTMVKELKLVPRKKQTIIDDFGKEQLKNIARFKAFINFPDNINYRAVVDDCFNVYSPLIHHAEPKPWPHIKALMEHIFEEQIELGYDYMQLLYMRPIQALPILCLVSRENGTGKTSFLDLLKEIYSNNAILVGNSEMASEFNALISGKLIVGIDESALGSNPAVVERIKMISTAKNIPMQRKGKDHEEVENFTKFVLCSNDETRFIRANQQEVRFWVRKIHAFPKNILVPEILPILSEEVDGFLSFLVGRTMHIQKSEHRMWFSPEMLHTKALDDLKDASLPAPVRQMKEAIRTLFMDFPEERYNLSVNVIKNMVPEIQRLNSDVIIDLIRIYFNATNTLDDATQLWKTKYIKIPYYYVSPSSDQPQIAYHKDKAKAFTFLPQNFLNPEELAFLKQTLSKRNPDTPTLL